MRPELADCTTMSMSPGARRSGREFFIAISIVRSETQSGVSSDDSSVFLLLRGSMNLAIVSAVLEEWEVEKADVKRTKGTENLPAVEGDVHFEHSKGSIAKNVRCAMLLQSPYSRHMQNGFFVVNFWAEDLNKRPLVSTRQFPPLPISISSYQYGMNRRRDMIVNL